MKIKSLIDKIIELDYEYGEILSDSQMRLLETITSEASILQNNMERQPKTNFTPSVTSRPKTIVIEENNTQFDIKEIILEKCTF